MFQISEVQEAPAFNVIDPLMAFVQPDANKEQAIRRVMTRLKAVGIDDVL